MWVAAPQAQNKTHLSGHRRSERTEKKMAALHCPRDLPVQKSHREVFYRAIFRAWKDLGQMFKEKSTVKNRQLLIQDEGAEFKRKSMALQCSIYSARNNCHNNENIDMRLTKMDIILGGGKRRDGFYLFLFFKLIYLFLFSYNEKWV